MAPVPRFVPGRCLPATRPARRRRGGARLLSAICLVLAIRPCLAEAVAILTEADGEVRVERAGQALALRPVASIDVDSTVVLAPHARAVLAYTRGGLVFELLGQGRFQVQAQSVELREGSGEVRQRNLSAAFRALKIHADTETLQGGASMRGLADRRLQARGPTGNRSSKDSLAVCWASLGPHWRYRLRLIDDQGRIVFERSTAGAKQDLPAAGRLTPGANYVWHLAASAPYGNSAEAVGQFRRLQADADRALSAAAAELARADAAGDQTGQRLFQIALRQYGLDAAPGRRFCADAAPAP